MSNRRKVITYIATSADGYIARKDGSVDWLDRPRVKGDYGIGKFYRSIDTILWGRKTYEMALGFQAEGNAGANPTRRLRTTPSLADHRGKSAAGLSSSKNLSESLLKNSAPRKAKTSG